MSIQEENVCIEKRHVRVNVIIFKQINKRHLTCKRAKQMRTPIKTWKYMKNKQFVDRKIFIDEIEQNIIYLL